jgi:hypothetical protein
MVRRIRMAPQFASQLLIEYGGEELTTDKGLAGLHAPGYSDERLLSVFS